MAEDAPESDQKTEEASPHRLERMREEGQVPRSSDVPIAVSLLAAMAGLSALGADAAYRAQELARRAFTLREHSSPLLVVHELTESYARIAVPFALAVAGAIFVTGVVQTRGFVSFAQLAPKWDRLDPLNGIKKVIPTKDTLIELGKTLLKVAAIGFVAWRVLHSTVPRLLLLARTPAQVGAIEVTSVIGRLFVDASVAVAAIAALDWFLVNRKFDTDARMTKQEMKDEYKEQEGDPGVKAKRRARARQVARLRTIAEVKNASVLVTNPTHLSVALRYEPGKDAAPMVLAKGADELALRMREEARTHRIPIVENRPLARGIYKDAKVGRPIPVELYEACAHVIAHVLRLKGQR